MMKIIISSLIIGLLLASSEAGQNEIQLGVKLISGKGFELTCNAAGENVTYHWTADNGKLLDNEVPKGNKLSINDKITYKNYRTFCCEAFTTARNLKKCIGLPMLISITGPNSPVAVGASATLKCYVTDRNPPKIHINWKRADGLPLPNSATIKGGRLTLRNLTKADAGIYICEASSDRSRGRIRKPLKVVSPVEIVDLRITRLNDDYDNNVTIQCITKPDETIRYQWKVHTEGHTGLHVNEKANRNFLSIYDFKKDNEGNFCCIANNALGSKQKCVTIKLPVLEEFPGELIAELRDELKLTCKANGNPEPSVQWQKFSIQTHSYENITPATLKSAVYEIESASENTTGLYLCLANNLAGSSNKTASVVINLPEIEVQSDQNITPPESSSEYEETFSVTIKITIIPAELWILVGESSKISCTIESFGEIPKIDIIWQREDELPISSHFHAADDFLEINEPTEEDSGEYFCIGLYHEGGAEAFRTSAVLHVDVPMFVK